MAAIRRTVLFVDLSTQDWHTESLPEGIYQRYLSGLGLGAYILSREIPAGADPLGPDNVLGFVAGILTGTGAMFSGRWMVVGKSPLTGGWGDANCGGNLAPAIKQCGYDGIFFRGVSAQPVYVLVDGKGVSFCDAADLWGSDAVVTEDALVERHGKKARVACIGQAGEKRSLISGIVNDHGRLAARSGLGAVMGSKNLKALVLIGSQPAQAARPEEMKAISKRVTALIPKGEPPLKSWMFPLLGWFMGRSKTNFRMDGLMSLGPFRKWGTTSTNEMSVTSGDGPVRNWRGLPRQYRTGAVSATRMSASVKRQYHCYACPLGCGAIETLKGTYPETHRPEYETTNAFGAMLLNHDSESIFTINELLNRAGMDSISAGGVVAFALDCYEHGLISKEDAGGLELTWGNSAAILKLVEMIVKREGIGDVLADGVRLAAERIGRGSEAYAIHAGGQELPMHDPRHDPAYGVYYTADATPGRHTIGSNIQYETFQPWTRVSWAPAVPRSYPVSEQYEASAENGLKAAAGEMLKMVIDGAGACIFGVQMGVDRLGLFEALNAATGWNLSPEEYMEAGRRVASLRQSFNIRHGVEPGEVKMPGLISGHPAYTSGPLKGKSFDVDAMRAQFWKAMGWDERNGHPPVEESEL